MFSEVVHIYYVKDRTPARSGFFPYFWKLLGFSQALLKRRGNNQLSKVRNTLDAFVSAAIRKLLNVHNGNSVADCNQ